MFEHRKPVCGRLLISEARETTMARNKQEPAPAHVTENAATMSPKGANTAQGEPLPPLVNPNQRVERKPMPEPRKEFGPTPERNPDEKDPEPPPRFKVMCDARIANNGLIATLRAGKVIDAREYDIPLLKKQGVQLQPV